MGTIDLMECISTLPITIISRDICARPNTFALETIRPGKAGETETLVLKRSIDRKNTMVERHMLSADTKEVRVWMGVRYCLCLRTCTCDSYNDLIKNDVRHDQATIYFNQPPSPIPLFHVQDRVVWCNVLNKALNNLRMWNPNALRPMPKREDCVGMGGPSRKGVPV